MIRQGKFFSPQHFWRRKSRGRSITVPTTYICFSLRVHHSLYFLAFYHWRNFHNVIFLCHFVKVWGFSNFALWIFQTTLIFKSSDDVFLVFLLSHKEGLFKRLSRTAFEIMNLWKWRPFNLYEFYSAANYWCATWKGKPLQLFSLWSPRNRDDHAAASHGTDDVCWKSRVGFHYLMGFICIDVHQKHLHGHAFLKSWREYTPQIA